MRRQQQPKEPGRCVHCGCTAEKPCILGPHKRCSWMIVQGEYAVCSKRECVQAEIDLLFAKLEERQIA